MKEINEKKKIKKNKCNTKLLIPKLNKNYINQKLIRIIIIIQLETKMN